MKRSERDQNIIRYRRPFRFNIGILVFAVVLVYFVVYIIQYATAAHVSIYEVQKGQIMVDTQYTGLVIRSETVTYANKSGSINYYSKEGDKTGLGDLVCSIDSEGSISNEITAAGMDASSLTRSDLLYIQDLITDFTYDYSEEKFYNVYSFEENLNSQIQENLYLAALENLDEGSQSSSFSLVTAATDGILAFYTDGYEGVTTDTFTAATYDLSGYSKTNLKKNTSVLYGDPIYKTITDENWYMMVPLDGTIASAYRAQMGDSDSIVMDVTFKKDDASSYATCTLENYGSQAFLKLAFNTSMIRYVSDRYLEVELDSSNESGLKIPNSAIVNKTFFLIPADYVTMGDNSSDKGVTKITVDKDGGESAEFVSADIYYTDDDGNYYMAGDGIEKGDTIQMPDSTKRYKLNVTDSHAGVYNMNRGYAVFRLIEPISSNGEYTIVETGTSYGLSLYDRIALNGDSLEEGDFAN